MNHVRHTVRCAFVALGAALAAAPALAAPSAAAPIPEPAVSRPFAGPKANRGTVRHEVRGGEDVLVLSDDFQVPDAPDPHWRLVDSRGTAYLLERLVVKPDRIHQSIAVPRYVRDVASVQIWCAFAETLLGEAAFDRPQTMQPERIVTRREQPAIDPVQSAGS